MKVTLFLTEQCNRNCQYCDIGTSKQRNKPALYYIKKFIPLIAKNDNITQIALSGGEIGLLNETTLDFIFENLKNKLLHVNTNGTFIRKGYYKKYKQYINEIMFHPISEIDKEIKEIPPFPVVYHFPVHKLNIHLLAKFLDKYSFIEFE